MMRKRAQEMSDSYNNMASGFAHFGPEDFFSEQDTF